MTRFNEKLTMDAADCADEMAEGFGLHLSGCDAPTGRALQVSNLRATLAKLTLGARKVVNYKPFQIDTVFCGGCDQ